LYRARSKLLAIAALRVAAVLVLCGASLVPVGSASGQDMAADTGDSLAAGPDIAILPIVNNTELSEARAILVPLLEQGLTEAGLRVLARADLRSVLREHRIRAVGGIGPAEARLLAEKTGARNLLIVSLDVYRPAFNPEVALTARILDPRDARVLAAAGAGATGEDYASLFGLGRLVWIEDVARRVVAELLEDLFAALPGTTRREGACTRVALVPLDDLSDTPHAGRVVGSLILAELLARGYEVIEPGVVKEIFLAKHTVPKGRIARPEIAALYRAVEPCLLITGVVARFDPAQGSSDAAIPAVELGLRVLDGASGRLLLTWDKWMDGSETESVLGFGRERALVPLTRRMVAEMVDRLDDWRRTNLAHNN